MYTKFGLDNLGSSRPKSDTDLNVLPFLLQLYYNCW